MEKSIIENLRGFPVIDTCTPRSTFTTTFYQSTNSDIRKSRINNLPGNTGSDIQIRLPFVVTFQAIQIQRLSHQISVLRRVIKDSPNVGFLHHNYQMQIKELTEQCKTYEKERAILKKKINRMSIDNEQLQAEDEVGKGKLITCPDEKYEKIPQKIEQENSKEEQNESQSFIKSKQMESQQKKHQIQKNFLENQIKKLVQLNEDKDKEISQFRIYEENLKNKIPLLCDKNSIQLQEKISALTEDILKLNETIRRFREQNDKLQVDREYFIRKIKDFQQEKIMFEIQNTKVPQLVNQIQNLKIKYAHLQQSNESNEQKIKKNRIFQDLLQNKQFEIQSLKNQLDDRDRRIEDLSKKCRKYQENIDQLNKEKEEIPKLQRKFNESHFEKERIFISLQTQQLQLQQAKRKRQILEQKLKQLQSIVLEKHKLQADCQNKQKLIKDHEQQINQLKKTIEQCQQLLGDEQDKSNSFVDEIEELNRCIREKNQFIGQLEDKLLEHKESFVAMSSQTERNKQQLMQMNQKLSLIQNQLKLKTQQLKNTQIWVGNVEKQMNLMKQLQTKFNASLQERQNLWKELSNARNQKSQMQNQIFSLENNLMKMEDSLFNLNEENQILKSSNSNKDTQIHQKRLEIESLSNQLQRSRQFERLYSNLKDEIKDLRNRSQKLQKQLRTQHDQNEKLRQKNLKLQNLLDKIKKKGYFPEQFKKQYHQIKIQNQQKVQQLINLNRKILNLERIISKLKSKYQAKKQQFQQNNRKWKKTKKQILIYMDEMKEMGQVKEEMINLMEENLMLEGTVKNLNLEMIQSQNRRSSCSTNRSRRTFNLPLELNNKYPSITNLNYAKSFR